MANSDRNLLRSLQELLKKLIDPKHENFSLILWSAIAIILGMLTLNGFVELTEELFDDTLQPVDEAIFEYVWSFRSDGLTLFMTIITWLGGPLGYLLIMAGLGSYLYFVHAHWRYTIQVFVVLLLAGLVNIILKEWIDRPRPAGDHLVEVFSLSYPSGHAMSAMSFYGFLIYIAFTNLTHSWSRYLLSASLVILIFLVGLSRVYLGVHFPSDVAAGFLAGLFWVALCILIFNLITIYRRQRHKNIVHPPEETG
ncbi:MAG: phosphatase PAP2 family protein [Bacteroidia bacterium]